jgi:hypothetical protein
MIHLLINRPAGPFTLLRDVPAGCCPVVADHGATLGERALAVLRQIGDSSAFIPAGIEHEMLNVLEDSLP